MARLNLLNLGYQTRTHEGAPARHISPEHQLRRSVLACLLWESQFYEDGIEIAGRIAELVPKVVAWANGPLAHIFGNSLADPRVTVEVVDVHDVIARAPAVYAEISRAGGL